MVSAPGRKSDIGKDVWSFTQPILSTYLARELHKRIGRTRAMGRGNLWLGQSS